MTVIYNGPLTLPTETQLPVTTVTYTPKTKLIVAFIGGAGDYDSFSGIGPTYIVGERQYSYLNGLREKFKNTTVSGDFCKIIKGKGHVVEFESYYMAKDVELNRVRCYCYGYDKAETTLYEKIKKDIMSPMCSDEFGVIVVGHSLGGYKAARLVEKLTQLEGCKGVDFSATLDPVGEIYFAVLMLPNPKPKYWINVYTNWNETISKGADGKEVRKLNWDNVVASLGNRWDLNRSGYSKALSLNIDAPEIGHASASGMMRRKSGGVSIDSVIFEITKKYLG